MTAPLIFAWKRIDTGSTWKNEEGREAMKIEVLDKEKMVCVWLTHADQENPAIQEQLKLLYQEYHQKKYFVSVFYSGHEDLEQLTGDLLKYNRKKIEENKIAAEKKKKKSYEMSL